MVVLDLFYKAKAKRYTNLVNCEVLIGTMCCIFYGFGSDSRSKTFSKVTISKYKLCLANVADCPFHHTSDAYSEYN